MVKVLSYLLSSLYITAFCLCLKQPSNPVERMLNISPELLWKTADNYPGPEEVDSLRFTVFSADGKFNDTIQEVFSFNDHQGVLSVPANCRLTLKVEGLDEQGKVIYKGTVQINDASDQDIKITLDASQVTPRKPSGFSATALSPCNYMLSWRDRSNNETGFIVEHRYKDKFITLDTLRAKTEYLHTSVEYSDYQVYRIFAFNNAGTSDTITDSIKSPSLSGQNKAPQFLQNSEQLSGTIYLDQTKKIVLNVIDPDCDDFYISASPLLDRSEDTLFWTPGKFDFGQKRLWAAATDASNASDTLFWVWDVKDSIRPVITLLEPDTIRLAQNDRYVEPGVIATDNVDGDISDKVIINQSVNTSFDGTYNITYSVSDRFGNEAVTKTRTVYVLPGAFPDRVPPVIFLVGGDSITHHIGTWFTDPGVFALDNREDSSSISGKITVNGKVDTTRTGIYQIIYKVKDESGNEAQKLRYVKVIDGESETLLTDTQTAVLKREFHLPKKAKVASAK